MNNPFNFNEKRNKNNDNFNQGRKNFTVNPTSNKFYSSKNKFDNPFYSPNLFKNNINLNHIPYSQKNQNNNSLFNKNKNYKNNYDYYRGDKNSYNKINNDKNYNYKNQNNFQNYNNKRINKFNNNYQKNNFIKEENINQNINQKGLISKNNIEEQDDGIFSSINKNNLNQINNNDKNIFPNNNIDIQGKQLFDINSIKNQEIGEQVNNNYNYGKREFPNKYNFINVQGEYNKQQNDKQKIINIRGNIYDKNNNLDIPNNIFTRTTSNNTKNLSRDIFKIKNDNSPGNNLFKNVLMNDPSRADTNMQLEDFFNNSSNKDININNQNLNYNNNFLNIQNENAQNNVNIQNFQQINNLPNNNPFINYIENNQHQNIGKINTGQNPEQNIAVKQFLEVLDSNPDKQGNILDNYGTFQNDESYNSYNKSENEIPLPSQYDNFNLSNQKIENKNTTYIPNGDDEIYNMNKISNAQSKISNIYQEYEKYKNEYNNKLNNIKNDNKKNNESENQTLAETNIYSNDNGNKNPENQINKLKQENGQNNFVGRNENLYKDNISKLIKLGNNEVKINEYQEKNNKKEKDYETLLNSSNNIDLVIKYPLPNKEDNESSLNKMSEIKLQNVKKSTSIKTLINEIKSRIINELKEKGFEDLFSINKLTLLIPGNFLIETKSIQDYDLSSCNFTIQASISYIYFSNNKKDNENIINNINENKDNKIEQNKLAPFELIPKLTKQGYKCIPSIIELSRMTAEELKCVKNFRIYNQYGEVLFKEPINLLGVNLDEEITIEKNLIDTGEKLNYWSQFKLFNFSLAKDKLNQYKQNLEKAGGNFIEYKNNIIVWEYKK